MVLRWISAAGSHLHIAADDCGDGVLGGGAAPRREDEHRAAVLDGELCARRRLQRLDGRAAGAYWCKQLLCFQTKPASLFPKQSQGAERSPELGRADMAYES
jgi:hypothetical protein